MKENRFMILLIFMLTSVIIESVFASTVTPSNEHELILQILNDRKEKFSTYTQSLDDASGIFGMKTKSDIKKSQKILVEIVKLDNGLIQVLNRQLDFKGFEKTNSNYDQLQSENRVKVLQEDLKISEQKLIELQQKIKDQNSKIQALLLSSIFMSMLFLLALIRSYRKKTTIKN